MTTRSDSKGLLTSPEALDKMSTRAPYSEGEQAAHAYLNTRTMERQRRQNRNFIVAAVASGALALGALVTYGIGEAYDQMTAPTPAAVKASEALQRNIDFQPPTEPTKPESGNTPPEVPSIGERYPSFEEAYLACKRGEVEIETPVGMLPLNCEVATEIHDQSR